MGLKMKAKAAVVPLVAIAILGLNFSMQNVNAKEIVIREGFYNGNNYLRLSQAQQVAYVSGVVDGIYLAPVFDAEYSKIERLHKCLRDTDNVQIQAIVDKFLRDNPQRWHEPMNNLVYSAIVKACGLKW